MEKEIKQQNKEDIKKKNKTKGILILFLSTLVSISLLIGILNLLLKTQGYI